MDSELTNRAKEKIGFHRNQIELFKRKWRDKTVSKEKFMQVVTHHRTCISAIQSVFS